MSSPPRFFLVLLFLEAVSHLHSNPSFSELFPSNSAGSDYREGNEEEEENPGDVEEPIDKDDRDANSQQTVYKALKVESVSLVVYASLGHGVAASAGDSVTIPIQSNPVAAGVDPEEGDETKSATKLSYVTAPLSGAALFGVFSGYLGEQTGRSGSNRVKLCNAFLVASFVSAMSSITVVSCRCLRFCSHPRLVTAAAWMSAGYLLFAVILASWPFLQGYLMLAAAVPPMVLAGLYLILGACRRSYTTP